MSDPNPPVRGLVAGKYELLRLIGRGGMGSVWEGRHATLGARVAIKFVDPEYADSPEARLRFMTEARAAATIQSKYAIQIHDHGLTDDGRPYIVMELLSGEPLDRRIERVGRVALTETARILAQVCRALQRAHDAGIIHRDLKPENIFLVRSPDDDDEIAKVLDFGIAKFRGPPGDPGLSSSTKTGAVLGTPFYMSPEQARGLRNIDHRTDLWSLGIIAYKCVTGVLPFDGESVGDLLVKICTGPVPVPSLMAPGLPLAFDAWFARSLERAPERRFATATELSDALVLAAGLSQPLAHSGRLRDAAPAAASVGHGSSSATPPAAGVTSAPFTASALPAGSSRGVWAGVVAAALLGGTLGVVGVARFLSSKPGAQTSTGVETFRPIREAPPSASVAMAPPGNVPNPGLPPSVPPIASPGPPSAMPHGESASGTSVPRRATSPSNTAKAPSAPSSGQSIGTSPPPAKPANSPPKPSLADPGY
ncbi:MAG TPA: protein kinase [Polyangiaceae bacterium]|nr:protein kinase [Polyangiaceae bacterium]